MARRKRGNYHEDDQANRHYDPVMGVVDDFDYNNLPF